MLRRKLTQKRKLDDLRSQPQSDDKKAQLQQDQILYHHTRSNEIEKDQQRVAFLEEAVLGTADDVISVLSKQKVESEDEDETSTHSKEAPPQKKWEDSDDEDDDRNGFTIDNPSWATNFHEDNAEDSDEEILKSHSNKVLINSKNLPSSALAFKQVTNGNKEDPASDSLTSVQFHPKATVLLTGSSDKTLRLFAVDGSKNRKIHSLFLERTPVMGAKFSREGSEIIIGSIHKSFYIYDMEGNNGITFRPKVKGLEIAKMSEFEISPDGRFIAFLGTNGYVHLFSQKSHELIESLKANGLVLSAKFSSDGKYLYTFGVEGEVFVFDLDVRECIHHFSDEGCVSGQCLAISPDGKYVALGSDSGIVNLYNHEDTLLSSTPKPIKSIKNLTTCCHQALFNSQSQLLALRTKFSPAGVRMVHFPTLTVMPNFPNHLDPDLKAVTCMNFSPNSGYFACGTDKGKCLLYRLEHYSKY